MPLYTPNLYFISDIKYGPTNIFSFSILNLLILILQTTLPLALLRLLIVAFIANLPAKTLVKIKTSFLVKLSVHIFTEACAK